ncbi:MAG TPA: 2-hydroxychromene-2-carboxylate isomerase [Kofleriaceae bacterium]
MRDVEFLFDYASPYSYLANEALDRVLPGVRVTYQPVYLRGFETFAKGVPFSPAKLMWTVKDLRRAAEELGVKLGMPPTFPVNGLYGLRAALAARRAGLLERFHTPMFRAVWRDGRESSTKDGLLAILADLGLSELGSAVDDPAIKDELKTATEAAAKRGAFGVPTFFVGDELFWGHDRMHQVAKAAHE